MTDLKISVDNQAPEKKADINDIKETLRAADAYEKVKAENDKLEAEIERSKELINARLAMGGRAYAGDHPVEKTKEEIAKEEAAKYLAIFK